MKNRRRTRRPRKLLSVLLVLLVLAGYSGWALLRPLPALQPQATTDTLRIATTAGTFAWPATAQAAVSIPGTTVLDINGTQKPTPMASTAKIVTSLMVLKKYPLKLGEQGPMITLTQADVDIYNNYVAQDGSVTPVVVGEQISEYQMLQAIMLPSANNLADSIVIWAYGSLAAYATAANAYMAELNLKDTHIGTDASGLAPDSVSSARDLVRIGDLAMQNPVLASIAGQSIATGIPVAGTIRNVNILLGNSGIVGIKTGNSDQAGGVFVGASTIMFNKKPLTIVTAVAATPDLGSALTSSLKLTQSAQNNFATTKLIRAGDVVGHYIQPWGSKIGVVASRDLIVTSWRGATAKASINMYAIPAKATQNQIVGHAKAQPSLLVTSDNIPLKLAGSATEPTALWRLTHPIN